MCGRFSNERYRGRTQADEDAPAIPIRYRAYAERLAERASYDVRPTAVVPILIGTDVVDARWGWERAFATGSRIINARWETAAVKPTFAEAVRTRRCVVVATAYYEWRRDERDRPLEKFAFRPLDGQLFRMAGIWEDVDGERRFLVFTRAMQRFVAIHDRTPVMLSAAGEDAWLNPASSSKEVVGAAQGLGDDDLVLRRVPSGPTKAHPAGPHLLEPLDEPWPL